MITRSGRRQRGARSPLRARLDEARAGRGQMVLLTGEPGIGKTRLAGELGRYAEAAGTQLGRWRASDDELMRGASLPPR